MPLVIAAGLEAGALAISDRIRRRRLLAASQAALAASLFACAWLKSAWGLALALSAAGTASGIACGAAQALLIDRDADGGTDRAMLRWSLFSSMGDVLTPIATAGVLAAGHSYRVAMAMIGGVVLAQSLATFESARAHDIASSRDRDEPAISILQAFSRALRMPRLWAWLFASASCTLLDELVIALAALRLVHGANASVPLAALSAVFFALGAVLGAVLAEKWMAQVDSKRILFASATLSLIALAALLLSEAPATVCASLFVLGVFVAPQHPLALARAYDELPDNPGVVQACLQVFAAIDVGAPLLIGLVADRYGLNAALACLALQPLVVLGADFEI